MNAKALFESAIQDLERGFRVRGETRMRQAAEAGHGLAQLTLAKWLASTMGPEAIRDRDVLAWIEKAEGNDVLEAPFFRSVLRYIVGERKAACDDLNHAAIAGHPPAQTALALAWFEHGNEEARQNGRAWMEKAAARGEKLAKTLRRTGWQDAEAEVGRHAEPLISWASTNKALDWKRLSTTPSIKYCDNVFSPLESAWLRLNARPKLKPSLIVDPVTRQARPNPIRTSTGMNFGLPPTDVFVARLTERVAAYAGLSLSNAEPLAVLRYCPGQQYKAHRDALGGEALSNDALGASGDRSVTALVYLNSPKSGGMTVFPLLDLAVQARMGRLLVFQNTDNNGKPEQKSVHIGAPVSAGTKWLASLWLRERHITDSFAPRQQPGR